MQYDMYARVDITDNGMGIDYTETEAIFKNFIAQKRQKSRKVLELVSILRDILYENNVDTLKCPRLLERERCSLYSYRGYKI